MTTKIDRELCIGCELCPALAPELYEMDDEGKAVVIKAEGLSETERAAAIEAADSCPSGAIITQE